jgi:hypothetical protein
VGDAASHPQPVAFDHEHDVGLYVSLNLSIIVIGEFQTSVWITSLIR